MHVSMFLLVSRDLHRLADQRMSESVVAGTLGRGRLKLGKVSRGGSDSRSGHEMSVTYLRQDPR
jgi:hypothetical protein